MSNLSERISRLESSGIRKIFQLATEGAKNGKKLLNLSIGQPDFPVGEKLKEAASRALKENFNAYFPTAGYEPLREKIAGKLKRENGFVNAKSEEVLITAGTSGGIFLALSALVNEGDEVIVPDPYFVLYKEILTFLGAKIVYLDTYPNFHIDAEKLKKLIKPKTKLLLLNSPNNPTGAVYSRDELLAVAKVAKENDLWILSDEIYEKFDYGNKFFSIGSVYAKTITLNGFSKSHAVPGWRMGYAHGPAEVIEAMNKLQQYTFVCAPGFMQKALTEEFEMENEKKILATYKARRDLVWDKLKDTFEFNRPEGAFYAFIKLPKGKENLVEYLAKKGVLLVPGSVFSRCSDYFRLAFCVSNEALEEVAEKVKIF